MTGGHFNCNLTSALARLGGDMFNALNIVDSLFNTNHYLLFDFPGTSAGVGHIDIDKIDWYCRKYFLTNT